MKISETIQIILSLTNDDVVADTKNNFGKIHFTRNQIFTKLLSSWSSVDYASVLIEISAIRLFSMDDSSRLVEQFCRGYKDRSKKPISRLKIAFDFSSMKCSRSECGSPSYRFVLRNDVTTEGENELNIFLN